MIDLFKVPKSIFCVISKENIDTALISLCYFFDPASKIAFNILMDLHFGAKGNEIFNSRYVYECDNE